MTRVTSISMLENCLDNSTVKELALDEPLSETIMNAAAAHGVLKYYPHFPKPYFRIERAHCYVVQGVIGSRTMRVTFSPCADERTERALVDAIEADG